MRRRHLVVVVLLLLCNIAAGSSTRIRYAAATCAACVTLSEACMGGTPTQPTRLVLARRQLTGTLDPALFHGCASVRVLQLEGNQLTHLPKDVFSELPFLRDLNLAGNALTTIDAGVFDSPTSLQQLERLYLSQNRISSFAGRFAHLPVLAVVHLMQNQITALPDNLFANTPRVTDIYFSHNVITQINPIAFADLPALEGLALDYNLLVDLPPQKEAFGAVASTVRELSLSHNKIASLHKDTFGATFHQLVILRLNNNRIKYLPDAVFANMPVLTNLDLAHNLIYQIRPGVFSNLHSLRDLQLGHNNLRGISSDTFQGSMLTEIREIHLESNFITTVQENAFRSLQKLESLHLQYNAIRELRNRAFHDLVEVTRMNLAENALYELQPMVFTDMADLSVLNLNHNELRNLPEDLFQGLARLSDVDLLGNVFECSETADCIVSLPFGTKTDCETIVCSKGVLERPEPGFGINPVFFVGGVLICVTLIFAVALLCATLSTRRRRKMEARRMAVLSEGGAYEPLLEETGGTQ